MQEPPPLDFETKSLAKPTFKMVDRALSVIYRRPARFHSQIENGKQLFRQWGREVGSPATPIGLLRIENRHLIHLLGRDPDFDYWELSESTLISLEWDVRRGLRGHCLLLVLQLLG